MRIVKPFAKLLDNKNNNEHIVKCAQICYASEKIPADTEQWLKTKINAGHLSIFRHGTYYYVIPISKLTNSIEKELMENKPFVGYFKNNEYCFVSINLQTYIEHPIFKQLDVYKTNELGFIVYSKNDKNQVIRLLRRTFLIQTQISTSRELNRVSPNNICEQSTRYCNYSNEEKFDGQISVCEPHWADFTTHYDTNLNTEQHSDERCFFIQNSYEETILVAEVNYDFLEVNKQYPLATKGISQKDNSSLLYSTKFAEDYLKSCIEAEYRYLDAIKHGVKPQDARGLLPLDTATKVVYTYRIEEWAHILDLRYYGKTGVPHPNAKLIANLIRQELNKELEVVDFNYFPE